jgi:hypothetical protein
MNTLIPHLYKIETYETTFKSLFIEWKEINDEIIVPFIIIPEEYKRYKNFKLIQIAMLNGTISNELSTFYKDVTDFFYKYADYFSPLTTYYYIQKERITDTQKIVDYIKYKKVQYKSKSITPEEIWLFTDGLWLDICIYGNPEEEKKEELNYVSTLDEETQKCIESIYNDDQFEENFDTDINFDEFDLEEKKDQKVMRLMDFEDEIEEKYPEPVEIDRRRYLDRLTVPELRELCKESKIKPIPKIKKEMVDALLRS